MGHTGSHAWGAVKKEDSIMRFAMMFLKHKKECTQEECLFRMPLRIDVDPM